jgi:hypothetical protein
VRYIETTIDAYLISELEMSADCGHDVKFVSMPVELYNMTLDFIAMIDLSMKLDSIEICVVFLQP